MTSAGAYTWDAMRTGERGEPLDAVGGVTSWGSLLILRMVAVSPKWCAAGTVLLLLLLR